MLDDKDEFVSGLPSLGELNNLLGLLEFVSSPSSVELIRAIKKIRFERFGVPHTKPLPDPHGRGKVIDIYI